MNNVISLFDRENNKILDYSFNKNVVSGHCGYVYYCHFRYEWYKRKSNLGDRNVKAIVLTLIDGMATLIKTNALKVMKLKVNDYIIDANCPQLIDGYSSGIKVFGNRSIKQLKHDANYYPERFAYFYYEWPVFLLALKKAGYHITLQNYIGKDGMLSNNGNRPLLEAFINKEPHTVKFKEL